MIQAVIVWQDSDNEEGSFSFNFKSLTDDDIRKIITKFQDESDRRRKAADRKNPHKPTKKVP